MQCHGSHLFWNSGSFCFLTCWEKFYDRKSGKVHCVPFTLLTFHTHVCWILGKGRCIQFSWPVQVRKITQKMCEWVAKIQFLLFFSFNVLKILTKKEIIKWFYFTFQDSSIHHGGSSILQTSLRIPHSQYMPRNIQKVNILGDFYRRFSYLY